MVCEISCPRESLRFIAPIMEAVCTSGTSVYFSKTARLYIPEGYNLNVASQMHCQSVSQSGASFLDCTAEFSKQ
jgi:hypothetical protein